MAKGLLIVIGATAAVSVAIGGSMSSDPGVVAVEQAAGTVDDPPNEETPVPEQVAEPANQEGTVQLNRSADGHFYADVQINGAQVHALVDTGASGIALSRSDARSAGLATSLAMNEVVGRGADGDVFGERVTLDKVTLGHRSAEDLAAVVLNSGEQTLLGQNFLNQFDSVEIRGDTMVLR
jgi:aspartyl protease family protein